MLTTSPGSNVSSVGVRPLGATLSGSSARCIALFRRSNMAGVYRRPPDGRAPPIPLLPPEMPGLLEPDLPLSAPLEPAATPPPVPELLPDVAYGAGWTLL